MGDSPSKIALNEGGSEIKFVFSIESDETRMIELDIILPLFVREGNGPRTVYIPMATTSL